jgi:hypothetical protein
VKLALKTGGRIKTFINKMERHIFLRHVLGEQKEFLRKRKLIEVRN